MAKSIGWYFPDEELGSKLWSYVCSIAQVNFELFGLTRMEGSEGGTTLRIVFQAYEPYPRFASFDVAVPEVAPDGWVDEDLLEQIKERIKSTIHPQKNLSNGIKIVVNPRTRPVEPVGVNWDSIDNPE